MPLFEDEENPEPERHRGKIWLIIERIYEDEAGRDIEFEEAREPIELGEFATFDEAQTAAAEIEQQFSSVEPQPLTATGDVHRDAMKVIEVLVSAHITQYKRTRLEAIVNLAKDVLDRARKAARSCTQE